VTGRAVAATPVPLFDLHEQHAALAAELDAALRSVTDSQRFILGPEVRELEEAVAECLGVRHAVGCASGTDALLLVLRDLASRHGVSGPMQPSGDTPEVVIPAFTFFATAGAVWNAGLRPAFCDIDEDTFNATARTIGACVSARTVMAIPVHLFGQMAEVERIRGALDVALFLLEDGAQATGARRRVGTAEVPAGMYGDAAALSFFPTKNLGAFGDAGMITTNDDGLADRLRKLRVHGGQKMYHHEFVGTNSRLDTLQAAVLLAKLPHLDGWLDARRRNAALYDKLLADVEPVRTPVVAEGSWHTYNQYTIRAERRGELRAGLAEQGIGTGVYYPSPLHLQPCFRTLGYAPGDFPVAERLCGEVLSLPIYPELGEERVRLVAGAIRRFYKV